MSLLATIKQLSDVRQFQAHQLLLLAEEVRQEIISCLSIKEGHLGANLGVVELTIALHYSYNTPTDHLIWDVGHQAYTHKLLTQRSLATLRQKNGISGFPSRAESESDDFGTGHSSTSLSAILGMAIASEMNHQQVENIAVIGDASIVSGMAFEALNHIGSSQQNITIILNDNQMGIDPSVGAFSQLLASNDETKIAAFFSSLSIHYLGIIDGHSIHDLCVIFTKAKLIKGPKLIHIKTTKGKGYLIAEKEQTTWHAPGQFDIQTAIRQNASVSQLKYQDVVGNTLLELLKENKQLAVITPAMLTGSGLVKVKEKYPLQTFDVGIAEQHALTLAAGMVTQGIKVFVVIYSTFLQRAYDQLIHDICLQNLPVIILVDRAGMVGEDGATHQGVYDISFISSLPNIMVAAPIDAQELRNLIYTAQSVQQPFVIRYPKGLCNIVAEEPMQKVSMNKVVHYRLGKKLAVLTTGTIGQSVINCIGDFSHYHFVFIKPLNFNQLDDIISNYTTILTLEEGVENGGFGQQIQAYASTKQFTNIFVYAIKNPVIEQRSIEEQLSDHLLDQDSIQATISKLL